MKFCYYIGIKCPIVLEKKKKKVINLGISEGDLPSTISMLTITTFKYHQNNDIRAMQERCIQLVVNTCIHLELGHAGGAYRRGVCNLWSILAPLMC